MTIEPIAYFHSPFLSKFGVPRQSGLVEQLRGQIVFEPEYRNPDALRGLEDYDYLWIVWGFSANVEAAKHPTVRPPRLGGNRQMGVFATRSPFRPNNIGMSSARILGIEHGGNDGPVINVAGADLMNGTPIYDIKPYITFTDSHEGARSGIVDVEKWQKLQVVMPEELRGKMSAEDMEALIGTLEQDPRPQYQDDNERIYGMPFGMYDVRFGVSNGVLRVVDMVDL